MRSILQISHLHTVTDNHGRVLDPSLCLRLEPTNIAQYCAGCELRCDGGTPGQGGGG